MTTNKQLEKNKLLPLALSGAVLKVEYTADNIYLYVCPVNAFMAHTLIIEVRKHAIE